jgi:hypothetical protein
MQLASAEALAPALATVFTVLGATEDLRCFPRNGLARRSNIIGVPLQTLRLSFFT